MNKKDIIKVFSDYVSNYDMQEEQIKRKYYHSLRVMKISSLIAKSINLDKHDIFLASIIGLLHDFGRFSQWEKYHTYNDLVSCDHGDEGANLLFKENEIEKYNLDHNDYNIIYNSIKYHNKYNIDNSLSKKDKVFLFIIRDADKIDILYLESLKYSRFNDNDFISKDIKEMFFNKKLLDRKKIKNNKEYFLLHLALIFEINYKYSFNYLLKTNLLEKIYNRLTNKEEFKEYFDYLNRFIKERID